MIQEVTYSREPGRSHTGMIRATQSRRRNRPMRNRRAPSRRNSESDRGSRLMTGLFPPSVPGNRRRPGGTWLKRTTTGALLFGVVAFARLFLSVFFRGFKSSQVYKEAVAKARSNSEVRRELGEPVRPGWWVNGSLRVSGPYGIARFSTP